VNRWGALPLGELTPDDELELRALVADAYNVRFTPLMQTACEAIVEWWDLRYKREQERRQRSTAAVLKVLRETAS